jgi:hypothetical protein
MPTCPTYHAFKFTIFTFLACINFDGNLLRIIPSLLQPLPCNRVNILNLDCSYGLVCLTGMVLTKLGHFYILCSVYVVYFTRPLCYVNRNMENNPGKQYNHKN